MISAIGREVLAAFQASISVLLVILYGALCTRWLKLLDSESINKITKVSTDVLLPCLLFTEMGKESSAKQLAEYWILPVFTVVLTALSLLWATIGVKALRMPNWLYTAAACPNYTSLPLLLIESLKRTGVLGRLLNGQSDTVDDALSRAKLYFLVTGLAGNIIHFALGPYLIKKEEQDSPSSRDGERQPLLGGIQPGQPIPNLHPRFVNEETTKMEKTKNHLARAKEFFNPPLVGGLLAIIFGVIGPTRRVLFSEQGALNASFTQSLKTLGKLYSGLPLFVLGGKLVIKKAGRAEIWPLLYLFVWRFFIVPGISISVVYGLRQGFPHYVKRDPVLDFVLAISHAGPPAITLSALAEMSGVDEDEQGVIATVLLASYLATPLMAFSVALIMTVIHNSINY